MILFLLTKHTQQTMTDIIDTTDNTRARERDRDSPSILDKARTTVFHTLIYPPKVAYFVDEAERDREYDYCIKETECFDEGEGTQSVRSKKFQKGRVVWTGEADCDNE